VAGRIVVVRRPGLGRRTARFAVRVDGKTVGKLTLGASREFEVEAGTHRVRVTQLGVPSRKLVVSVADGETVFLRTGLRYWINFLNGAFGGLIGGSAYWLGAHDLTSTRLVLFAVGLAGCGAIMASGATIKLRLDPAGQPRFGHTDIPTDTIHR
jgi:hypothetical protein